MIEINDINISGVAIKVDSSGNMILKLDDCDSKLSINTTKKEITITNPVGMNAKMESLERQKIHPGLVCNALTMPVVRHGEIIVKL